MEQAPQLLLVDDDRVLCEILSTYLQSHGFAVTLAHDGPTGLQQASEGIHDVVILNVTLPGLQGIEVLQRIRMQGELPVIMLAPTNDEIDRIVGLEMGADDYLSRSCSLRELLARLNSILRRTRKQLHAHSALGHAAGLRLFPVERTATWRGKALKLTSTEFELLEVLLNHPGKAVSKSVLAREVLGRETGPFDRSLDMHISNLRKKLGPLADGRSPIQTVHGAGYQLLRN